MVNVLLFHNCILYPYLFQSAICIVVHQCISLVESLRPISSEQTLLVRCDKRQGEEIYALTWREWLPSGRQLLSTHKSVVVAKEEREERGRERGKKGKEKGFMTDCT